MVELSTILSHWDDVYDLFVEQALELATAKKDWYYETTCGWEGSVYGIVRWRRTAVSSTIEKEQREKYASRRE